MEIWTEALKDGFFFFLVIMTIAALFHLAYYMVGLLLGFFRRLFQRL